MGITTHGESVQPLQSVKLICQLCSQSRAALRLDGSGWLDGTLGKGMVGSVGSLMESKC